MMHTSTVSSSYIAPHLQECPFLTIPVGQEGVTDAAWLPNKGAMFGITTTGGCTEIWDLATSVVQPLVKLADATRGDRMLCLSFAKACPADQPLPPAA